MIKVTNTHGIKIYINEQLIEQIITTVSNQSEIIMTTGKRIVVTESPEYINRVLLEKNK